MADSDESLGEQLALCARNSLCDVINRPTLMQLLKKEDLDGFRAALEDATEEQINAKNEPQSYTCLEYASERGLVDFVTSLLEHGADPQQYNTTRYGNAILFAAKKGQDAVLKCFLARDIDLQCTNNRGRTALHLVVETGVASFKKSMDNARILRCLEMLLEDTRMDIDLVDRTGATALHLAARGGWWPGVEAILKYGPDLDVDLEGSTVRQILEEDSPDLLEIAKPKGSVKTGWNYLKNSMFRALYQQDTASFVNMVGKATDLNADDGTFTFLQYCCKHGLYECAHALLEKGAKPDLMSQNYDAHPVAIAATHGYHRILSLLLAYNVDIHTRSGKLERTVLHIIALREFSCTSKEQDYDLCLAEVLLNPPEVDGQDGLGNTALHYAARNGHKDAILALLRKGASLGAKNKLGEPPVAIIAPDVLEDFLDECIVESDRDPESDQFQVTLQYGFLAPKWTAGSDPDLERQDPDRHDTVTHLPETEPLWYLWQSSKHQYLLKHPVLSSFLHLKFQCICCFYYLNLLVHTIFVITLSYYLHQTFGKSESVPSYMGYIIAAPFVFIIIRESVQMAVSLKRYLISFENLCEVALIVLTFLVLYSTMEFESKRHMAPILMLLLWCELLFILGQHPSMCMYMTMFATVGISYVKFLAAFSLMICAFALSFALVFYKCEEATDCDAFHYFPTSVLRTCVMMIGEFEFGSLPFDALPGTSEFIFFLFLFLVVIVLLNLLNGLAVSDTQAIRERAELVGCGSRLQLISYIECTVLGDPLHFFSKWGPYHWMRRLPDCTFYSLCHRAPKLRRLLRRITFGNSALLFRRLPKMQLQVTFSDAIKVYPAKFHLDTTIAEAAKSVVLERSRMAKEKGGNIQDRLDMLENKVDRICTNIETLIRALAARKID